MEQWAEIRRRVLVEQVSQRQILRETGMHWQTLQKILQHSEPPGYRRGVHADRRRELQRTARGWRCPLSVSKPTLLLEHYLKQLKLPTMLREYAKLASLCQSQRADYQTFLLRLCEREVHDRELRAAQRRVKTPNSLWLRRWTSSTSRPSHRSTRNWYGS